MTFLYARLLGIFISEKSNIMKTCLTLFIAVLTFSISTAQKIIQEEIVPKASDAIVDFQFADNITIKTWNKNQLSLKAEVNINEGKDNDYFNLKIDNTVTVLKIKSDYADLFKKGHHNCNIKTDINYTLFVPKTLSIKIKSITGNVNSTLYEGALIVDIISGNIDIKNYNGVFDLKTVSGDIDVHLKDSKIKAETVTGQIYADHSFEFKKSKANAIIGQKVSGVFDNASNELSLQTVSGNIFIRKK